MSGARMRAGWTAALLLAALGAGSAKAPTRGDLHALRRRVALLESELALSKTRKPYVIVDAEAKLLRYRLLGMTMRELPLQAIEIGGLARAGEGGAPGLLAHAGTVFLKEKDGDPRLSPLTPAEIEAGAADENVADALPPEAPAGYTLHFRQRVAIRVEGLPESRGAFSRAAGWWRRLWPGARHGADRIDLRVALRLEEGTAREVYRSLVPGEPIVLVPPRGYLLPDVGQEAPGKIKPGKAVKVPAEKPGPPAEGVPFQIPPPIEAPPEEESRPANGGEPGDENAPAVEAEPDPDWEEVPPAEARPTPSPGPGDAEAGPPQDAPPSGGA
ncbi:MAG TPA: hypothetical protein VGV60_13465 [Candidatus Polarisedimenticolia bacterium]|jgi:hypothetical protein|nr:hypothetical protein [Candidatus Polarisedimenticolia bacterium]